MSRSEARVRIIAAWMTSGSGRPCGPSGSASDCGSRTWRRWPGVSRRTVGELERGAIAGHDVQALRSAAAALGAVIGVRVRWNGADLDRLLASVK